MTRRIKKFAALVIAIVGLVVTAGAQSPATDPRPALVMTAHNETAASAAARGAARPDSSALPGDIVRYTMRFTNVMAERVRNVKIDNPLPRGLQLIAGSTRASRTDAIVAYSADSGRTFSARPTETVLVDGIRVTRPIPATRYTHVRWVLSGWVEPNATVTAEYAVRVAAATAEVPGNNARPPRQR